MLSSCKNANPGVLGPSERTSHKSAFFPLILLSDKSFHSIPVNPHLATLVQLWLIFRTHGDKKKTILLFWVVVLGNGFK